MAVAYGGEAVLGKKALCPPFFIDTRGLIKQEHTKILWRVPSLTFAGKTGWKEKGRLHIINFVHIKLLKHDEKILYFNG